MHISTIVSKKQNKKWFESFELKKWLYGIYMLLPAYDCVPAAALALVMEKWYADF